MNDKELGRKIFLSQVKVTLGPTAPEPKYMPIRTGIRHKYTVRYKGKQFTSFCRVHDPKLDLSIEENKAEVMRGLTREMQREPRNYSPFSKADQEIKMLRERLKEGVKRMFGPDLDMMLDLFGVS